MLSLPRSEALIVIRRAAASIAAILTVGACSGPESPAPKPSKAPLTAREALRQAGPEIPRPHITDRDVATFVAGSRHDEEAAAIARILSRQQSPARREFMRQQLADPNVVFHSSSDPVVADDLTVINQIRALDGMAHQRDQFRIAAQQSGATLLVGLSTSQVVGSPAALIVRPAARFKENIILITDSTSTDQLATAIGDVQALRLQFGDSPFNEQRIAVRQAATQLQISATTRERYNRYLSDLKQAPTGTVPGFGVMRMIRIPLPPVKVGRPLHPAP